MLDILGPILAWVSLLVAPPIALIVFTLGRKGRPKGLSVLTAVSATALLVILLGWMFKISFYPASLNVLTLAIGYSAYSFLAISCWLIGPRIVRYAVLIVTSLPIVAGYVLALLPIAVLPFLFFVGEQTAKPVRVDEVEPGLACATTYWGAAFTDEGYTVRLFRYPTLFPLVHQELGSISVDESDPGTGPKEASCKDVLSAVGRGRKA